ncbi:MAG: hypothetical protein EOM25_13360 [Deltaproteobacteria bacterium]|nr:hypothetical protein [Deltaproteobacteria bacterium]
MLLPWYPRPRLRLPLTGMRIETEIISVDEGREALKSGSPFLTAEEIEPHRHRADAPQRLAARIAAKRAVARALGLENDFSCWPLIAIDNLPSGQPMVQLQGSLAKLTISPAKLLLSLSHCPTHAVALVVLERVGRQG